MSQQAVLGIPEAEAAAAAAAVPGHLYLATRMSP